MIQSRAREFLQASASIRVVLFCLLYFCGVVAVSEVSGAITLSPQADGTLADGGDYGPFDGVADDWDWSFNQSSYEGAITLNRGSNTVDIEHRLVFEYNLSSNPTPPITAKLTVLLRGGTRFPAADTDVHVYAYPADLLESAEDFFRGPVRFVGKVTLAPLQVSTYRTFNVSRIVNDLLNTGTLRVGFRCQVNPTTPEPLNQAFMDSVDSEPLSKPTLTIDSAVPGDSDLDLDVDSNDFRAFTTCFRGPGTVVGTSCQVFDFDGDSDVDLIDFESFQYYRSFFAP